MAPPVLSTRLYFSYRGEWLIVIHGQCTITAAKWLPNYAKQKYRLRYPNM